MNPTDSLNPMSKSFASTEISYEPPKLGFKSANTTLKSVRIRRGRMDAKLSDKGGVNLKL